MQENADIFDFTLSDDEVNVHLATLDTGASLFFDHRDPVMVKWLNGGRSRNGAVTPGISWFLTVSTLRARKRA